MMTRQVGVEVDDEVVGGDGKGLQTTTSEVILVTMPLQEGLLRGLLYPMLAELVDSCIGLVWEILRHLLTLE